MYFKISAMAVYFLTLFIYFLQANGVRASNLDTPISVEVGDSAWLSCGSDVGKKPGGVVWFKTTQGDSSPPVPVIVCSVDRALLLSCESDAGTSARHATYSCSKNHDLNIRNAEVSDSGTYRCAAAAFLAEYSCKNATTMDDWNVLNQTWLENNNQLSTSVRLTVMGKKASVEKTYIIKVHTGDVLHAGTDSRVFIFINGSKNNLETELSNSSFNCFERNQIDFFTIKTKNLGCITEFNLSHNQHGLGSDWYLDSIDVYEGHNHYEYEWKEWIDGSRKIRLHLKDAREAQNCQVSASEGSRETSCLHGTLYMTVLCGNLTTTSGAVKAYTENRTLEPTTALFMTSYNSMHQDGSKQAQIADTLQWLVPVGTLLSLALLAATLVAFCLYQKRTAMKRIVQDKYHSSETGEKILQIRINNSYVSSQEICGVLKTEPGTLPPGETAIQLRMGSQDISRMRSPENEQNYQTPTPPPECVYSVLQYPAAANNEDPKTKE